MEDNKVISGSTKEEIWSQLKADIFTDDTLTYSAVLKLNAEEVSFSMDIDPGGGFEGGVEFMKFKAPIHTSSPFKFAVHDKNFVDAIGKFFGMMDVEVGHENLDKHLIIKTNDEQKVRALFSDPGIREAFMLLTNFNCAMHHSNGTPDQAYLELHSNYIPSDPETFRKIVDAFFMLLAEVKNAS